MNEIILGFVLAVISYWIGYWSCYKVIERREKKRSGEFVDWI